MDKQFVIYWEIFGKKIKSTIWAKDEASAKTRILAGIKFNKVQELKPVRKSSNFLDDEISKIYENFFKSFRSKNNGKF